MQTTIKYRKGKERRGREREEEREVRETGREGKKWKKYGEEERRGQGRGREGGERGRGAYTRERSQEGKGSTVTDILCMTSNVNTVEYVSSAHCTIHAKLLHRVEKERIKSPPITKVPCSKAN